MKVTKVRNNQNERGSAGMKMVAVLVGLFLAGHAAVNYIPVAYNGASFKEEMQTAVVQGTALPAGGNPLSSTQIRIKRAAESNNIPPDVFIEVKQINGALQAHAIYSKKVDILPFGLYTYNYKFDHIATPVGFLTK